MYCVGCATSGSILVRAEFDLGSDFFTDSSNPLGGDAVQIDAALIEIEVLTPLTARANLELFMGPGTVLSFKPQSVLPIPISTTPFAIPGLLTIGPIFDFGVAVDLTGPKGQANFTYGAEMVVPKGAKARIQFGADGNNSVATGWEGVDVDEIPFFLNQLEGELSFGLNITARPSITFGILAGGGKLAKLDAGFELDLPKVYAKATKRSSKTPLFSIGAFELTFRRGQRHLRQPRRLRLSLLPKWDIRRDRRELRDLSSGRGRCGGHELEQVAAAEPGDQQGAIFEGFPGSGLVLCVGRGAGEVQECDGYEAGDGCREGAEVY